MQAVKGLKKLMGVFCLVAVLLFATVVLSEAVTGYWQNGDWSARIAWEARKALSKKADGTSGWKATNDPYGSRWYGDYDYVASDSAAYQKAFKEAGGAGNPDFVGPVSDDSAGHHRGGQCTFFVRLILYRSSYWSCSSHLTTPGYPGSVYSWTDNKPDHMIQDYTKVQPGYVFSSPHNHMAIADSRDCVNKKNGWWVIDSNYVTGNGGYCIGKHFMPDSKLLADNYWAWKANWATSN